MRIVAGMLVFLFLGCTSRPSEDDLKNLNGYWEIEKVTFPEGQVKEFSTSTTIDYFELKGLEGFRKKVQPKLDGTFETSNDAEPFIIIFNESRLEIQYRNEKSEWTERIMNIDEETFSVINEDTLTYTYKRFQPIEVTK